MRITKPSLFLAALMWMAPCQLIGAPEAPKQSDDCKQAYRSFYGDRYVDAMASVNAALVKDPKDLASLLLKSQLLAAGLEFDRADALLGELDVSFPKNPYVLQRRAELVRDRGDGRAALDLYESTLAVAPDDRSIALSFASYLYLVKELGRADALYREATQLRPFQDREMLLNSAMILSMKDKGEDALLDLATYRKTFGEDSQVLLAEGVVLWKLSRRAEAADRLTLACWKNLNNLAALRAAGRLLLHLGMPDQVLALLKAAVAANPGNPQMLVLSRELGSPQIAMPPAIASPAGDVPSIVERRGPIEYTCSLPVVASDPALLATIDSEFQEAFRHLSDLLDYQPSSVRVKVLMDTGLANPAFYDYQADCITISAKWFKFAQAGMEIPLKPEQLRELTRHVVRHELSHLVLAHKIGIADYQRGGAALPLWLVEGFAEWAAGGAQNVCRSPEQIKRLFDGGLLDYSALQPAMQVTGHAQDPDMNHKAYVESFFIVKHLIGHGPDPRSGLEAFVELTRAIIRGGITFEAALEQRYRVSLADFQAGWTRLLQDRVIAPPVPVLSSTP